MKIKIMGILNITPDSFSDGGIYFGNIKKSVDRVSQMLSEGADIIDIGGESTRPGADKVSLNEELRRVLPVIKEVRRKLGSGFDLSIDTYKAEVAREALKVGANMVNSVGGFLFDKNMADIVVDINCPIAIYHIRGIPRSMQKTKIAYKDVIGEIMKFFEEQIDFGIKKGIKRSRFIIDPGIGFGKNVEQNIEIIRRLNEFKKLNLPILIGVSRKSHLGILLKEKLKLDGIPSTDERLEASLAETAIAVLNGATIVRTHDVLETKKFLAVIEEFYE